MKRLMFSTLALMLFSGTENEAAGGGEATAEAETATAEAKEETTEAAPEAAAEEKPEDEDAPASEG